MGYHKEVADDELTHQIIGVAIDVHTTLGSQHSEQLYQEAFIHGLEDEGLEVEREKEIPVVYRGRKLDSRYADLLVEDEVVVEIKAVKRTTVEHFNQLGTNVKLLHKTRGLLINFGESTINVRRFANTQTAHREGRSDAVARRR